MDDFVCNYYGGTEWTAKMGWPGHDAFNAQEFQVRPCVPCLGTPSR